MAPRLATRRRWRRASMGRRAPRSARCCIHADVGL